jgi:hypothetical protein
MLLTVTDKTVVVLMTSSVPVYYAMQTGTWFHKEFSPLRIAGHDET